MSAGVKVLAVDEGGQSQSDSVAQLVLVAQTDLALVVDLGAHARGSVQVVLGANAELGGVRSRGPGQLHAGVQFVVDLLVQGSSELLSVVAAERGKGWDERTLNILLVLNFKK